MFMARLLAIPGWEVMSPWLAAQQVQGSAFADGSNYPGELEVAGTVSSTGGRWRKQRVAGGAVPAGWPVLPCDGLPVGYPLPRAPARDHGLRLRARPSWQTLCVGRRRPGAFDCSGLTMVAWAAAGYPRALHGDQLHEGSPVDLPRSSGDLVLVPGRTPRGRAPRPRRHLHRLGLVLSAVDPQQGVVVQTWAAFTAGGLDAVFDPAPGH